MHAGAAGFSDHPHAAIASGQVPVSPGTGEGWALAWRGTAGRRGACGRSEPSPPNGGMVGGSGRVTGTAAGEGARFFWAAVPRLSRLLATHLHCWLQ
jgi:hypothetical protein